MKLTSRKYKYLGKLKHVREIIKGINLFLQEEDFDSLGFKPFRPGILRLIGFKRIKLSKIKFKNCGSVYGCRTILQGNKVICENCRSEIQIRT